MTSGVAGKVIAVTGVSSGIGRACARSLARQGALVVGVGRRADRGAAIADELRAEGHTMTSVTGDMTVVADCVWFIDAVVAEHGKIDALVNNVGGSGVPTYVPSEEVTPEQFDEGIALNVRSAFFCSTAAIRHMKRRGGGSIDEITDAIEFLCSDASRGVTATTVAVDQGRSAGAPRT